MQFLIMVFAIFLIPMSVFSQEDADLRVVIQNTEGDIVNITAPGGSMHNFIIDVYNDSNEDVEFIFSFDDIESDIQSLSRGARFYDIAQIDNFRESLAQNENNVVILCNKNDLDEEVRVWCEGKEKLDLSVGAGESRIVPMTISIDQGENDQDARLIVSKKVGDGLESPLKDFLFKYASTKKDIAKVTMSDYGLEKKFGAFAFAKWINAGLKERYGAHYTIENIGTKKIEVVYFSAVESQWIGENVEFEESVLIQEGEKRNVSLDLTMPRFGKVGVEGGIKYVDNNGNEQVIKGERIDLFVWPATLMLSFCVIGCFCVLTVLLYKYLNKNMFEFIKRKKSPKKENIFTGTYIVKDADNIISIAQRYGVPWKELAKINNIDPPYVLISGETIHVPGEGEEESRGEDEGTEKEQKEEEVNGGRTATENVVYAEERDVAKMSMQNPDLDGVKKTELEKSVPDMASQKPEEKDASVQDLDSDSKGENATVPIKPKKRKVTFASPKNMLTKPSSEPTTRAIDIDWMRDDEVAYLEEMEVQEKKTSRILIGVLAVTVLIVCALIWWGVTWMMKKAENKNVSVESLIINEQVQEDGGEQVSQSDDVGQDVNKSEEGSEDEVMEEQQEAVSRADVTVQVLNAGAPSGSAGSVTSDLAERGYEVKDAQNAQNDYTNVSIYHGSDNKDLADLVNEDMSQEYEDIVIEESQEVVENYDVDIVIVLGS